MYVLKQETNMYLFPSFPNELTTKHGNSDLTELLVLLFTQKFVWYCRQTTNLLNLISKKLNLK